MGNHIITDDGSSRDKTLTVLLIEDSPLIRKSLTEAIDALGAWRVTAYADEPDEAIVLLKAKPYDAVIVDLQLKRGSGIDVLSWLKDTGAARGAFVAVLTNHALPTYRERCRALGVQRFYDKSLEFDRVLDAMCDYARERV